MYLKQCEVCNQVKYFDCKIQDVIKAHSTIKKWAYIAHDKDLDAEPHYHIYLNFGNSGVDTKLVAEWFGQEERFINKVKGRSSDILLYLIHGNDTQKHKYQYSPSEVVANFDYSTELTNAKILGDFNTYSYAQQLLYVNTLPISEKASAYSKLEKLWRLHCQCVSLKTNRKLEVVFISGSGGSGKTTYAKKLFDSMQKDYCVSSSSNDPFQDYAGQKGMLLDDLRDRSFKFEDLLKILDNNTMSSVASRFNNKVFNGDLIIITSSVPIWYWYRTSVINNGQTIRVASDELTQLYRRITCYIEMTNDNIIVYNDGLDERGKPKGLGRMFNNDIPKLKRTNLPKTDFSSVFEKMCKDSKILSGVPQQLSLDVK